MCWLIFISQIQMEFIIIKPKACVNWPLNRITSILTNRRRLCLRPYDWSLECKAHLQSLEFPTTVCQPPLKMNDTFSISDMLLCPGPQGEVQDKLYIIISISLLSIIGLLSVVGNTLVLLVYCQSPRICCGCCFPVYPQWAPRYRRGLQHSQKKLLIALAAVDLLTAITVLPSDIGRKVLTLLSIRIYCDANNNDLIYAFIDNARNMMFALEGSILTSIALDRFMVIGCPYIKTMSTRWRSFASSASELSFGQASCADLQLKSGPLNVTEDNNISLAITSQEDYEPSRKLERQGEHLVTPSPPSSPRRQLCVLLPIAITTLAVMSFEVTVFLLHIKQHKFGDKSQPAIKLRYFLNRLYLISTMVTFPLVCGPYICVFLAVRSFDKKRAHLCNRRSNRPKRSWRTALTLFIATLVFYLTLLPVLIFHFGNWSNEAGSSDNMAKDVHMHPCAVYIHHEFYYINNAVNFFIYSWVSPAFRRRLKELCKISWSISHGIGTQCHPLTTFTAYNFSLIRPLSSPAHFR